MAATVLLLTSYVLLAVYVLNVDGSNRRRSLTQADHYCVNGIFGKCINQHMAMFGTRKSFFSRPLEDHCRFANNSLDCAFEELHSTEGRCRLISEEAKERYTDQHRVWKLFVSRICETGFDMFNKTYDCIGRNFDSFDNMRTSCLTHQSRVDLTFDSRCDGFLQNRGCTGLAVKNICGESEAGWNEFIHRFEQFLTTLKKIPNNCRELAVNKHACESQIEETCLLDHLNFSPKYYNYLASKTLKEQCGLIEKMISCAGDVLENTTSKCAKLNFPQGKEFNYLLTIARTVHTGVCETGFTEFNAAYDCLVYKLKNVDQLWNLTGSCLPDWNDEAIRMNVCDNFEISRTCLQNSSAAICGEEVGETVNEFIENLYNDYAVDIWGTAYDCSNSSMKRSFRHLLNKIMRK